MGPKAMKGQKKPSMPKEIIRSHESAQAAETVATNVALETAPDAVLGLPDVVRHNDDACTVQRPSKPEDSFSTNAALMLPVVILSMCTVLRAPSFGEVAWHTHTFLSAGGHGRIALGCYPKQFLKQTLVASSGRMSRYKGDFELVVFKTLLAVQDEPKRSGIAFSDILPEIGYLAAPKLLRHKNVIDLLGLVWETDQSGKFMIPTMILEFAPYGSLEDFFKSNPNLNFQEKIGLCEDICSALQTLHHEMKAWEVEFGIFHGDLKPANIMVFDADSHLPEGHQPGNDDPGLNTSELGIPGVHTTTRSIKRYTAKLADLGSAQEYFNSRLSVKQAKFGTLKWGAPELRRQTGDFDPALAEVYSFGLVVAYIFFDGTLPFDLAFESDRIGNHCSLQSDNGSSAMADTDREPKDQLLSELLRVVRKMDGVDDGERALIENALRGTLRADVNARESCLNSNAADTENQVFKQVSELFGSNLEIRERESQDSLAPSIDVWNSMGSQISPQTALLTMNLASQMPYAFRVMLDEHFIILYQRLPDTDPWKSHVAFSVGLLAVSPSLTSPGRPISQDLEMPGGEVDVFLEGHRRPLIGATWLRRAALLDHGSAGIALARLILAFGLDMDEDRMAEEFLFTAAIGDSVFAHEEIKELAPVKYRELITAIRTHRLGPVNHTYCYTPEEVSTRLSALYNDVSGRMIAAHMQRFGLEGNLRLLADFGKTNELKALIVGLLDENLTHLAATSSTAILLQDLLDLGLFNSSPNLRGDTPAHFAARSGKFNNLGLILKHSAPTSWSCTFGATPLHYLFRFQDERECKIVAKSLLEKGVSLEQQACIPLESILSSIHLNHAMGQPGSALHWAVARNHQPSIKVLLTLGASPYTKNLYGRTPWDLAVSARLIALLRLFENEGKCDDPEERREATLQGLAGSYPLTAMLSNGRYHIGRSLAMVSFLLEIGAATLKDVFILAIGPLYHDLRLLKVLISAHRQALLTDHDLVRELLSSAVITGEIQAARELLRCLPPLPPTPHTFWIFHQAVTSPDLHTGSIKILKTLFAHVTSDFDVNIQYSFDPTRKLNGTDPISLGSGDTLLHNAFSVCRLDLVKVLLENSADPCIKNDRGMTPLGRLIFLGNQQSLLAIESMVPSPNPGAQSTPFAIAYPEFLVKNALTQPLLRSSIFHQIVRAWEAGRVHDSATHNMVALKTVLGHFEAANPIYLQELLQMRDLVTDPTTGSLCDGNTVLHHAASKGFVVAVQLLIEHGADPFALNGLGKIPLDELSVRCWEDDFRIQEQTFASMGMPWIDMNGSVARKLEKDFDSRTECATAILKDAMLRVRDRESQSLVQGEITGREEIC